MTYTIIGGDKKEYGPISEDDLRQWITEGRLNSQSLCKGPTDSAWRTLGSFPEFAAAFSAGTPPTIGAIATASGSPTPVDLQRDYELDIGGCVSQGWNLYKENFGFLLGSFLIVFGITAVTSMIAGGILSLIIPRNLMLESEVARQIQHLALSVALALVAGPLSGGMYRAYLKKFRRQPVDFGEVFTGFSNFAPLVLGYLVIALISTICTLPFNIVTNSKVMPLLQKLQNQPTPQELQDMLSQLVSAYMTGLPVLLVCLIPATFLLVSLQFTLPLIADKNLGVGQALKTSWRMVNKHWFQLFGLTIVLGLITAVGLLGCCIGILFTIPISIAGLLAAYETIFGDRKNT